MSRGLAIAGTLCALLLVPPVFAALFALSTLHSHDVAGLWLASAALAAFSWLVVARRAAHTAWLPKLFLVGLSLVAAELAARAVVIGFTRWPREKLDSLGRATYPDLLAFEGHPFLQFIGRPRHTLRGNEALRIATPFNEQGFPDPALPLAKPPGVVRIVCLGASTTIPYPQRMRAWLDAQEPGRFETLNLAHGFYTTASSVVNFALNALDYAPDYVVVHHGWNDGRAAANAADFRGDYAHVYKPFEPPAFPDWLPIRASIVYRALRWQLGGRAGWDYLDAAVTRPADPALGHDLERVAATFTRNVRTIVDLALLRGITPVLVTLAHATDPDLPLAAARGDMQRLAAALREVARGYGERVVFVDLDAEFSGRDELFRDVGHMTAAGVALKAERIGRAILEHWRR